MLLFMAFYALVGKHDVTFETVFYSFSVSFYYFSIKGYFSPIKPTEGGILPEGVPKEKRGPF